MHSSQTSHFPAKFLQGTVLCGQRTLLPSQKASFSDKSLLYAVPSWNSPLNHVPQSLMSQDVFGWSPSLLCTIMHQNTVSGILLLHSQPVTRKSTIYCLFLSKGVWLHSQHLSQTSCSQPLATAVCSHCKDSLLKCLSTIGPTLGAKLLLWFFLSSLARRGLSTGPMGIQDTETLGILDSIDISCCTSSHRSMMDNNISRFQKEII